MGYSAEYFKNQMQLWLDAGWLAPGQSLIEFGAQEFYADVAETHREIAAFLGSHGLSDDAIKAALGDSVPRIRAIYEALGIRYVAIDVDDAPGSTYFDLNSFAPPDYWRNAFDFINNEGTIEHLINPINGFHVAHELAKVGGVIRHSFPLIGWREHGFCYPTTKFYAHMVGDNGYELLKAKALLTESEPFDDALFKEVIEHLVGPVERPPVTNIWGELVYRKTSDRPFVIPIDHVGGSDAAKARLRLNENYRRLAQGRIS
jgi:hypothetical protein